MDVTVDYSEVVFLSYLRSLISLFELNDSCSLGSATALVLTLTKCRIQIKILNFEGVHFLAE